MHITRMQMRDQGVQLLFCVSSRQAWDGTDRITCSWKPVTGSGSAHLLLRLFDGSYIAFPATYCRVVSFWNDDADGDAFQVSVDVDVTVNRAPIFPGEPFELAGATFRKFETTSRANKIFCIMAGILAEVVSEGTPEISRRAWVRQYQASSFARRPSKSFKRAYFS